MKISKPTRIALIVVAGCVVLGLAAISAWSGDEVDFSESLKILGTAIASAASGYWWRGKNHETKE